MNTQNQNNNPESNPKRPLLENLANWSKILASMVSIVLDVFKTFLDAKQ